MEIETSDGGSVDVENEGKFIQLTVTEREVSQDWACVHLSTDEARELIGVLNLAIGKANHGEL